jgi:glycosyltransferase involved in cell wall biosynthesis
MMRLALLCLTAGDLSGGYRVYLRNMLPRLARHGGVEALLCIAPEGIDIPSWFEHPPEAVYASCQPLGWGHLANAPDRMMKEALAAFSPEVLFVANDRYIRWRSAPTVIMIQNMEPFVPKIPGDPVMETLRKFVQRRLVSRAVRQAGHTIAVSGFVREHLTRNLGVPPHRVSQIYYGMSSARDESPARPASLPRELQGDFLLTCGSIRPARGLDDAIAALEELGRRGRPAHLVIAGQASPRMTSYGKGLKRALARRGLTERVCWAGQLDHRELAWCYDHCGAFLMTSRVESFGMIGLEAMSHGCLCVAAANPCLPELFGEAAEYYRPGDGASLADRIMSLSSQSREQRAQASEAAKERAGRFSWDVAADATVEALARTIREWSGRDGRNQR